MTAVLMTWNPGPHDDVIYDRAAWVETMVRPWLEGRLGGVEGTWSVARHKHGIGPGTTALLHRQGPHGRGLVARGTVTSEVLRGEHTIDPGRLTGYVAVAWREAVPVEERLDLADLEEVAPGFGWRHVYSSGRTLPPDVEAVVVREWEAHVEDDAVLRAVRDRVAPRG